MTAPSKAHPSQAKHDHYDRGADGRAMVARSAGMVTPEGKARGSIAVERIEVVHYKDVTLYDRMWARGQMSDRQHAAAVKWGSRWTAAGLNPRQSAIINSLVSSDTSGEDVQEREAAIDPDETARDRYRRLARMMPEPYVQALEDMVLERHPGIHGLARLHAALDWLVDYWKIRDPGE